MFNLPERREIKKIAKSKPVEHGLPFSTWSLSKLADFLVSEGWLTTSPTRGYESCSVRTALRYFALDGTGHPSHKAQASMIRRYIIWRNSHATDPRLRKVVAGGNVA